MPDIALRFHKDPLVLSAPLDELLARQGVEDAASQQEYLALIEPESVLELQRLEHMAGAQCVVTNTKNVTKARLAHQRFENQSAEVAHAALDIVRATQPQHVIAAIGSAGLPIDPESRASLKQSRDQYAQAARDYGTDVDALLLDGMASIVDLKCALTGVRMVSDLPVIASVDLDENGLLVGRHETWEEACAVMVEFGADVVGFSTGAEPATVLEFVAKAADITELPLLVQLAVGEHDQHDVNPGFRPVEVTPDNPYRTPDALFDAATALLGAGVQFLRAVGHATPSYTGALMIACEGRDCIR